MTNGCICCTLREDLLTGIADLAKQKRFDYVVVESSGISEPMPVAETFTFDDRRSGLLLKDVARLDTLVTVVDGVNVLKQMRSTETTETSGQAAFEGDNRPLAQLLVDQIEFANVVLLNKCDLLSPEDKLSVMNMLRKLNPLAVVYETTKSAVPLKDVLNTQRFSITGAEAHEKWLKEAREGEHAPESDEFGIRSFIYRRRKPFHPARFAALLRNKDGLPAEVLRAKGYCWVATRPNFAGALSCVGHLRNLEVGQPWFAAMERDIWPEGIWEDLKQLWVEPHGDRAQEIVVIGTGERADAEAALDACLLTDEEMAKEVWDFPDNLPAWADAAEAASAETAAAGAAAQAGVEAAGAEAAEAGAGAKAAPQTAEEVVRHVATGDVGDSGGLATDRALGSVGDPKSAKKLLHNNGVLAARGMDA